MNAAGKAAADVGREELFEIYRKAYVIHRNDERFRALLKQGKLAVVYYPVRGQEVISAAMMHALNQDDYLVTNYRGLHDHLAKGIPLKQLWAEFAGRATGTCKGKGGPMHITHPETGVMVTTGIVGSGLPIAAGLALSSVQKGDGKVTVVCFGDGATNIGAFHEAMNMASVWKLPVIFLCQNNQYAEHTAYAVGTSAKQIVDRAIAYDMKGVQCNGNDPEDMLRTAREAVERARRGEGPTLIEAKTFRMLGHLFGADFSYVPKEKLEEAGRNDPMVLFRAQLLDRQYTEAEIAALEAKVEAEIDEAVDFALESPFPDVRELRIDVFKEEIAA
jgi:acetoin:2,6-dichlorophenolindophenol oxidoreductase subunit alpha